MSVEQHFARRATLLALHDDDDNRRLIVDLIGDSIASRLRAHMSPSLGDDGVFMRAARSNDDDGDNDDEGDDDDEGGDDEGDEAIAAATVADAWP